MSEPRYIVRQHSPTEWDALKRMPLSKSEDYYQYIEPAAEHCSSKEDAERWIVYDITGKLPRSLEPRLDFQYHYDDNGVEIRPELKPGG